MPAIPNDFKPIIQGYGFGAPGGVEQTEIAGGMPRSAVQWDRGVQQFNVTLLVTPSKLAVWTAFFHHVIKKGALPFTMPLDSGFGLQEHSCLMVPGTYSVTRASGQVTSVAFSVVAESMAYAMTKTEAEALVDLWNDSGDSAELREQIAAVGDPDLV